MGQGENIYRLIYEPDSLTLSFRSHICTHRSFFLFFYYYFFSKGLTFFLKVW